MSFIPISVFCFALVASIFSQAYSATTNIDDLIAVVQVFRHGQRIPLSFYPNDPYSNNSYWPANAKSLTSEGKRQHYALGKFTRSRYDGFLAKTYSNDDFYIQTTDVDRTHMSAQLNAAGIFQPTEEEIWNPDLLWQPIPIHPSDEDVINTIPDCRIYDTELANIVINDKLFAALNDQYADVYEYITKHSGFTVASVSDAVHIYDTLYTESLFGYPLPKWTDSVYPEPLNFLARYFYKALAYTDEMKRLMTGSWLYTVAEYFEEMFEDPTSSPRFQVYSGHDSNIASILNTLGAFDPHCPAFASTLYFELRNKSGNAVINIWHKNEDVFVPITIKDCTFDCSLDDFRKILRPWLIDTNIWAIECAANSTSTTSVSVIETSPLLQQVQKSINVLRK